MNMNDLAKLHLTAMSRMPAFDGATGWLNSEPLTLDALAGKVVAVDFWTYTCINWLRTLPYHRAWAETYRDHGFVMVGALGLIRMPDLYTRMHAASVVDTLGAGLLIGGLMLQAGLSLVTLKLLFLLALFFFIGPVAMHALAQAALQEGVRPLLHEDRRERLADGDAKAGADEGN